MVHGTIQLGEQLSIILILSRASNSMGNVSPENDPTGISMMLLNIFHSLK